MSTHASGAEASTTVARNALSLVLGQAATTSLAIVLSATLGRLLGANDFGAYYLIATMTTLAYVVAEWGQPLLVIRQAARDPREAGELLGTALVLRVVLALLVVLPAGLASWALGYGAHTTGLAVGLILAGLPLFLAQGYGMIFRAQDRMGRDALVSVSNKVVAVCVTVPALVVGAGIRGVVVAQALAGMAALGIAVALHRRLDAPPLRVSSERARQLLVAGAPILAMTAAAWVQPYLDVVILSKLVPATVVGWFGAARNVLGTLMAPAVILGAAAYPQIARASADPVALRQEVRSAFRPLLYSGALAATGTYLFASTAVALIYGSRGFGPAATILQVCAPGLFLLFIDILLGNIIYASGGGTGFAVAKVASVVVGTALDLVLIPWFQRHIGNGGVGVVVAFALSELVVFAGAMRVMRPGVLAPAAALDAVRALAAAAVTILLFREMPPIVPWIAIPLCVATFTAASLGLGLLGAPELAVLGALAGRRPAPPPSSAMAQGVEGSLS